MMEKTYRIWFLLFCVISGVLGVVSAQNVSNVTAKQLGKIIEISYDLDRAADISVLVSTSNEEDYRVLRQVTGDVGKTVSPGHKTIIWNVLEEMEELTGDDVSFKVRVDGNAEARWRKKQRIDAIKALPNSTFFTLNTAYSPLPQWSFGFKVGQMKIVGWYASVMTNFNFKGWGHPFKDGYTYWLTDHKTVRFSAQAGFVVRPCKPMSLLFGVGYGYRSLTYKSEDNKWYSYPKRTYEGVDASFGFLFDIKGFILSAEAVTTNFQTLEARVGLGYCLNSTKINPKNQTVKVLR